ncbi:MAG: PilZ domain-containing protein, partial [Deferrisomatales bacterium]|nr:PilZ domain-containing protein [Deferrisomatales bacterium]
NLSLKGCLIAPHGGASLPQPGEALAMTIHLEEGAPELDVGVQGRVVRSEAGYGVAMDFREVSPESFQHLFRLVQYNAADPEDIEGELGTSAFDSPLR